MFDEPSRLLAQSNHERGISQTHKEGPLGVKQSQERSLDQWGDR